MVGIKTSAYRPSTHPSCILEFHKAPLVCTRHFFHCAISFQTIYSESLESKMPADVYRTLDLKVFKADVILVCGNPGNILL